MTTEHPSFLSDDDLAAELATARRTVNYALEEIRAFTVIASNAPWRTLDDLLAELRAAAITVAVLEGMVSRRV